LIFRAEARIVTDACFNTQDFPPESWQHRDHVQKIDDEEVTSPSVVLCVEKADSLLLLHEPDGGKVSKLTVINSELIK
jgi:hypothetical protein